jgi:hypothetical protein
MMLAQISLSAVVAAAALLPEPRVDAARMATMELIELLAVESDPAEIQTRGSEIARRWGVHVNVTMQE